MAHSNIFCVSPSASPATAAGRRLRRRRRCAGAITVETAFCIPILLMVVFFSIEFSRSMLLRRAMDDAAYEACRIAKVPGAQVSEATQQVAHVMNTVGASQFSVTVQPPVITEATTHVTVTVTAPLDSNLLLTGAFFAGRCYRRVPRCGPNATEIKRLGKPPGRPWSLPFAAVKICATEKR